ncbi:ABC transporter permease [Alkalicoccus luteus]|uniref:ABC transporter permease n=1 Tax=Alkalicoccus luteus TaxID=1237094 RepID=A0A969PTR4_9BACI|nr:ABC transporter permease [Alkalicoccus luteus]NJP37384.1 ABC transporter permease [Alkalicoccus luteus]
MNFSIVRTYSIAAKDMKELSKNMFVLTTAVMPFLFALMFGRQDDIPLVVHYLVINLTFASVTCFVQTALIAEEKEKKTLRSLMLSPATSTEILTGKSAVAAALTAATLVICMQITGYVPEGVYVYAGLAISLVFYLMVGLLLGLLARTLVEASVLILPVIFILGMGGLFIEFFQQYDIAAWLEYLPNFQLEYIAAAVGRGGGLADVSGYLLVITGWTVAAAVLTVAVYRKRTFIEE